MKLLHNLSCIISKTLELLLHFFHPFTHGFIALKYFPVAYREKCFPSYDSICNKQVLFVLFQLSSNTIQQTMTFLTCWETTPGVCYLSWRTFLQTCLWLNSCIFQSFSKLALKVLLHYRHQHTCTLTQVVFSSALSCAVAGRWASAAWIFYQIRLA